MINLIFSCVDLTLSMKPIKIEVKGLVFSGKTISYIAKHHLNKRNDEINWETSPLYAPVSTNKPPAYIFAAGLDPLFDEGSAFKNRLENNSNFVLYKIYLGQIYVFVTNSKHFSKGLDCLKEIGNAIMNLIRI